MTCGPDYQIKATKAEKGPEQLQKETVTRLEQDVGGGTTITQESTQKTTVRKS